MGELTLYLESERSGSSPILYISSAITLGKSQIIQGLCFLKLVKQICLKCFLCTSGFRDGNLPNEKILFGQEAYRFLGREDKETNSSSRI